MKNQSSKYLKYAIGEIMLVVVGILIALWINNWNEERKAFKNEQVLLRKLKDENLINLTALETDTLYRAEIPNTLWDFNLFLKEGASNYDLLEDYLYAVMRATGYTFTTSSLENYINLHNEEVTELNRELANLQSYQQDLELISGKLVDYKLENILKSLENSIDFQSAEVVSLEPLKSLKFRNELNILMGIESETTNKFNLALEQMRTVDSLINYSLH